MAANTLTTLAKAYAPWQGQEMPVPDYMQHPDRTLTNTEAGVDVPTNCLACPRSFWAKKRLQCNLYSSLQVGCLTRLLDAEHPPEWEKDLR